MHQSPTITELTGPSLLKFLDGFIGFDSPPMDPLANRFMTVETELAAAQGRPRRSLHHSAMEPLNRVLAGMLPVEGLARQFLLASRRRAERTMRSNDAFSIELEARLERLVRERQLVDQLDKLGPRFDTAGLSVSKHQKGLGLVPAFAVYAAGRLTGDPRCHVTITTTRAPKQSPTFQVASQPRLLDMYWWATAEPEVHARQRLLPNRHRHKGRGPVEVREIDIYHGFGAILSPEAHEAIALAERHPAHEVFIVDEATNWTTSPPDRLNSLSDSSPLVLGVQLLSTGQRIFRALNRSRPSTKELVLANDLERFTKS